MLTISVIPYNCIEKDIKPYVNKYLKEVQNYCQSNQYNDIDKIYIVFTSFNDDTIGMCIPFIGRNTILIDRNFWQYSNEINRYALIAHELTHCLFLQNHIMEKGNFMNPYLDEISETELNYQIKLYLKNRCI